MKRRGFVGAAVSAALAPAAWARAARIRTIGYLTVGPTGPKHFAAAMARRGWIEGRDVRYEVRTVARDGSDVGEIAGSLVRLTPDVLYAQGLTHVLALARATKSIPIVCGGISDPVTHGIARSLQRPGTNVTGLSFGLAESAALQVGTLRQLVPALKRLVFVSVDKSPDIAVSPLHEAAGRPHGVSTEFVRVSTFEEVERVLASLRSGADAAWVADITTDASPESVAQAATRRAIATHVRDSRMVRAGFLMSYWIVHDDALAKVAAIVDKVLRGQNPAEIPFEQPDKTEFVINRATPAALGIRLTPDILVRATEVVG